MNTAIVNLPPEGAFRPRASIIQNLRKFRKLFPSQKSSTRVSSIGNKHLNLKNGGGLLTDDELPASVHVLLCKFVSGFADKNTAVSLASQFLMFLQNKSSTLDEIILKYESLVYNASPFNVRTFQNGRKNVLKNTSHLAYEKWDSLLKCIHFDDSYMTT